MFKDKRYIWIALGLITLLFTQLIAPMLPQWIEWVYSRGIFVGVRFFLHHTLGFSPIPLLVLFYAIVIVALFLCFKKAFASKNGSFLHKIKELSLNLGALLGAMLFLFYLLWGFNYYRIPIEQQLNITPKALSETELEEELHWAMQQMTHLQSVGKIQMPSDLYEPSFKASLLNTCQNSLAQLGFNTFSGVTGRFVAPKGFMLRFGVSGVYMPYTGESSIDKGLHSLQMPFTLAHEYAHGYGFTDEGVCNFLALLVCSNSRDTFVQYSGFLSYWRYAFSEARRYYPDLHQKTSENLPDWLKNDLQAINDNLNKYPDIIPLQNVNDAYLKLQGVKEGIKSYNRILMLEKAYRKDRRR